MKKRKLIIIVLFVVFVFLIVGYLFFQLNAGRGSNNELLELKIKEMLRDTNRVDDSDLTEQQQLVLEELRDIVKDAKT